MHSLYIIILKQLNLTYFSLLHLYVSGIENIYNFFNQINVNQ